MRDVSDLLRLKPWSDAYFVVRKRCSQVVRSKLYDIHLGSSNRSTRSNVIEIVNEVQRKFHLGIPESPY